MFLYEDIVRRGGVSISICSFQLKIISSNLFKLFRRMSTNGLYKPYFSTLS